MSLRFSKMHGLGNDFVVLDGRAGSLVLDAERIRRMADRHRGVGFDQLLVIEPARDAACAWSYRIWNTDGSVSGQCGNGLRCVAAWLRRAAALGDGVVRLESPAGVVGVEWLGDDGVRADMGEPRFSPGDIPLAVAAQQDPYQTRIDDTIVEFGAVSMGNPHAVIEVDDIATAPLARIAPQLEQSALFPQRCNVGFVALRSRQVLDLRVWERGVGETLACGSGACAAVAVLRRRGRVDDDVRVQLPGGALQIRWPGVGHPLWMTGPATFVFEGEWHG